MKKLLVLLLALTLTGAAFAQVSFSGYIDTGVVVEKVGSADATFTLNGDDSGTTTRLNLNGSWKSEDGVVGANFRMRTQGDLTTGTPVVFMRRAYVWGTMLDGKVKLVAGKLGDYTWATTDEAFGNIDGPSGVEVQFMLIEGLNFGFYIPADETGTTLFSESLNDIKVGAKYTVADFGVFVATADFTPIGKTDATFGADTTPIENLRVDLEANLTDLGDDTSGATYLDWVFEYSMDPLTVGLEAEQQFWADDAKDLGLSFTPYASYTMDMVTLGGYFTYITAGDSGMIINPYVLYAMGKGADLELGAYIYTGDIQDVKATPLVDNTTQIYLSFTWSF